MTALTGTPPKNNFAGFSPLTRKKLEEQLYQGRLEMARLRSLLFAARDAFDEIRGNLGVPTRKTPAPYAYAYHRAVAMHEKLVGQLSKPKTEPDQEASPS